MRLSSCVPSERRPLRPDLQAVHVGAGLAGGRPELHESAAVSFRDTLTCLFKKLPVAPPPPSLLEPPPVGRELGVRRGGEEGSAGRSTLDCVVPNTSLPQIQPHGNPVLRDQEEPSTLWVRQRQP